MKVKIPEKRYDGYMKALGWAITLAEGLEFETSAEQQDLVNALYGLRGRLMDAYEGA